MCRLLKNLHVQTAHANPEVLARLKLTKLLKKVILVPVCAPMGAWRHLGKTNKVQRNDCTASWQTALPIGQARTTKNNTTGQYNREQSPGEREGTWPLTTTVPSSEHEAMYSTVSSKEMQLTVCL